MATDAPTSTISAKRMKAALEALMPHMLRPAMMRVLLRQAGLTPVEIDEHQAAIRKALAERFAEGAE